MQNALNLAHSGFQSLDIGLLLIAFSYRRMKQLY